MKKLKTILVNVNYIYIMKFKRLFQKIFYPTLKIYIFLKLKYLNYFFLFHIIKTQLSSREYKIYILISFEFRPSKGKTSYCPPLCFWKHPLKQISFTSKNNKSLCAFQLYKSVMQFFVNLIC
jgi:hypothetical protein